MQVRIRTCAYPHERMQAQTVEWLYFSPQVERQFQPLQSSTSELRLEKRFTSPRNMLRAFRRGRRLQTWEVPTRIVIFGCETKDFGVEIDPLPPKAISGVERLGVPIPKSGLISDSDNRAKSYARFTEGVSYEMTGAPLITVRECDSGTGAEIFNSNLVTNDSKCRL